MPSAAYARSEPVKLLSVIMPVYNEIDTVESSIKDVLCAEREGTEIELIIVESNSTDGSGEMVDNYREVTGVKVIHEDHPMGKGHAVRVGLSASQGDVLVIFDADGEYQFSDIWGLLAPIEAGESAFVLGSRHSKGAPVRQFNTNHWVAMIMNMMHVLFATLINLSFGTHMRDPFTMWKVFRRELLDSVTLTANRFDLDWEIVGKFALAGAEPVELPVNYESRDYGNGKKVRFFRDPLTWIKILATIRFSKDARALVRRNRHE